MLSVKQSNIFVTYNDRGGVYTPTRSITVYEGQRKPWKNCKIGVFGNFNDYNDSSWVLGPDK